MQQAHDVEYFIGSTHDLLGGDLATRASAPFRAFFNPTIQKRLSRYQSVGNFDLWLIHNVLPALSPAVYSTAFSLGVPVVHYLHNYRMHCINGFFLNHGRPCESCHKGNFWPAFQTGCWHDSRWISGWMGLITRRIHHLDVFSKVSAWIALSDAQRNKHQEFGLPTSRLHVVPHFFDTLLPPPPVCSNGDILFLGRLSAEKGVDCLLRAWGLVQSRGRKLVIAGDGPEGEKLRSLASSLKLKHVEFTGFINLATQRALWAQTAFSVIPSIWHEPFGRSLLESWGHGRTSVASRIGGLAELVREGQDGLLADPFSEVSLARQMQILIDSPQTCATMGSAGFFRVRENFHKQGWIKKMNEVFEGVLPSA